MIRLTPQVDEESELYPLGFEAIKDIQSGNVYVDENGDLVSQADLKKRLREVKGRRRVVRVTLSYRLPSDPVEAELRTTVVNVPVVGSVDPDELARIVHTATRNVYDTIRGRKRG